MQIYNPPILANIYTVREIHPDRSKREICEGWGLGITVFFWHPLHEIILSRQHKRLSSGRFRV